MKATVPSFPSPSHALGAPTPRSRAEGVTQDLFSPLMGHGAAQKARCGRSTMVYVRNGLAVATQTIGTEVIIQVGVMFTEFGIVSEERSSPTTVWLDFGSTTEFFAQLLYSAQLNPPSLKRTATHPPW